MATATRKKKVTLTETEQLYLQELKRNRDGVSRDVLGGKRPVRAYNSNLVDVHIKNLRKKIRSQGYEIHTLRGHGYKLVRV